ncbi:stress responsive A/B barrel domain protein [Aulographum hederae CBS 113979]|uniref:Stress responsive A/B barrel domain protein n=1 Tax=Aulographum hederae CBS 113979 TaxID=1176131 RepID=A0A6G1HG00_9PEZI|nr:stress responsive A/B barrel domain protein [Aulographum hederae CBS 113979]
MPIDRITMFKIPSEEGISITLDEYKDMMETAKKDGEPYILASKAYKLYSDPRSQGFTVAARSTFKSVEDMKYYDEACERHAALKKVVGPQAQGMMMIYMDE